MTRTRGIHPRAAILEPTYVAEAVDCGQPVTADRLPFNYLNVYLNIFDYIKHRVRNNKTCLHNFKSRTYFKFVSGIITNVKNYVLLERSTI